MTSRGVLMALAALVAAAGTPAHVAVASEIVCWTDDQGRRACGDRVPPEYARRERQVYGQGGRLVETLPRQKSPEEIAEQERQAAAERAARDRAREQAAYDRFLLSTFGGVGDLIKAREERLKLLDTRLRLAEKSLADNEAGIAELESQIADAQKDEKDVPQRLTRQLKEFQGTLDNNRRAVDKLRTERAELVDKYERDIARYRELTAPPPTPATAD